jgi:hypothetical protein
VPLFYFNIYNGNGLTEDEEGRDLPDDGAARAEALQGIRSILAEEVRQGRLDLHGRIEVLDGARRPLFVISFIEALRIEQPGEPLGMPNPL